MPITISVSNIQFSGDPANSDASVVFALDGANSFPGQLQFTVHNVESKKEAVDKARIELDRFSDDLASAVKKFKSP